MNRGEGKYYVIIAILFVAALVYGVVLFGPVYQHKWKFHQDMEETVRMFDKIGEEEMYAFLIRKAKALGLPPLTEENFYWEGGEVGQPALLQCEYYETINFPGGKTYKMRILVEEKIDKLPPRSF